jgi:hypothetical protein
MTEWGIDTLFNPGKRHMDEEKRRLQSTREEVGDSSGGRRIDLESGTVTISRRPKNEPSAAEDEASTEAADTEAKNPEAKNPEAKNPEAEDGEARDAHQAVDEAEGSAAQE